MLISRGAPLLSSALLKTGRNAAVQRAALQVRNSGAYCRYRAQGGTPPGSEWQEKMTDVAYTVFWWWVCFKCITSYDHLIGEYDWPDASKWTDEELGVPPDNYEPPSRS